MNSAELSADDAMMIQEEETIFKKLCQSLMATHSKRVASQNSISLHLEDLRDEASRAKNADLPALFDQMNTQRALLERQPDEKLPDIRSPYFAHMTIEENGQVRDVLLGHVTYLDDRKYPVIDWKHAPISRIFFNYREGEEFEEELPGRIAYGRLLKRRVLTIYRGELLRIHGQGQSFSRSSEGLWRKDSANFLPSLAGGSGSARRVLQSGLGLTQTPSPDVSALLDAEQFELLTRDRHDPLLILGGAGCGKTTVALHRMAFLHHQDPKTFAQVKLLVVVPEEGLVRLSRKLLESLGLGQVEVLTFDRWVENQARRVLKALPDRTSDYVPSEVSRLKRHPAVLKLFPVIVEAQVEEVIRAMERLLPGSQDAQNLLRMRTDLCLLDRFKIAEEFLIHDAETNAGHAKTLVVQSIRKFFDEKRKRYLNSAHDRGELLGNIEILRRMAIESGGEISEGMIQSTLSRTLDQLGQSSDYLYGGYSSEALETVDGKSLLEYEKASSLADTIDPEDFAIVLEMYFYKSGSNNSFGRARRYSHMVIDEAQDLAAVELKVLGRALEEKAAISIAGDAAQHIDPTHSFATWEHVLDQLGLPRVKANHLRTSYRSPEPIALFAHQILGPLAPSAPPLTIRNGLPVARTLFPDEGQMTVFLSDTLTQLVINEPLAAIALITKNWESALNLYNLLRDVPKVRLVEGGEFDFKPGIDITPATEVKGLEFDYVVIPDANYISYTEKAEDRRLFHVAATRAIHQLWVISVGRESVILPALSPE